MHCQNTNNKETIKSFSIEVKSESGQSTWEILSVDLGEHTQMLWGHEVVVP